MRNALIVAGVVVGGYFVWRWASSSAGCGGCSGNCTDCAQASQMTRTAAAVTDYASGLLHGVIGEGASRGSQPTAFYAGPNHYNRIFAATAAAAAAPQPSAPAPTTESTTTLGTHLVLGTAPRQTPSWFNR